MALFLDFYILQTQNKIANIPTMKNIGTKLRSLRELNHYKQDYVGNYLGIGQSAYSRIENGDSENISLAHVTKLAELYKITAEQLMGWDGKISIGTVNGVGVNQGTTHLNNVSEERIRQLEEKIEALMCAIGKG